MPQKFICFRGSIGTDLANPSHKEKNPEFRSKYFQAWKGVVSLEEVRIGVTGEIQWDANLRTQLLFSSKISPSVLKSKKEKEKKYFSRHLCAHLKRKLHSVFRVCVWKGDFYTNVWNLCITQIRQHVLKSNFLAQITHDRMNISQILQMILFWCIWEFRTIWLYRRAEAKKLKNSKKRNLGHL